MKIRYLLDENLSPRVKLTILRHYPELDVLRVGDEDAPALGTLDPDMLDWLDVYQRVLVTDNRKSIPGHIADHFAAGKHHWGIFLVRKRTSLLLLAEALYVYWSTTEATQWRDVTEWLPV
ncbi:DUF5615 family PIN-like protein [Candidatus Chloroploca sp. M-50]|uniref:DUF5615 family PIN-like protein n=1 Tax=Candidatus Chloroploca mongolica TaxID=2528176 RepID=A0ABS4DA24_9CHLR|nr:DUF5615 family PIN-like protein [Candidatus Chloroploca mongolica]MBP1466272.1 DUF5615 family PIN-like protein [Candidatus Chloroploca mongolica]